MRVSWKLGVWLWATTGAALACSASNGSMFDADDSGGESSSGNTGGSGTDDSDDGFNLSGTGGGSTGNPCNAGPDEDQDSDGYTINQGDCNDCDANVNPDAIEVQTDTTDPNAVVVDEDCDGESDEVAVACDSTFMIDDADPMNAARAIDLCEVVDNNTQKWGLVSAQYTRANGNPANPGLYSGLLNSFGANMPRLGDRMLGLSSGYARDETATDACSSTSCTQLGSGTAPPNFPQDVPGCTGLSTINDDIGLEVTLIAPSNATGYSFDFSFFSFEYPEWVCTSYNDQFIALVQPPPPGAVNGNISFDSQTNPVSVNIALFDHCDPNGVSSFAMFCSGNCPSAPTPYCPFGPNYMTGTGFEAWGDAGATGWLVTTAPISGGEQINIRFAIWDTGDTALDSSVLIDNFQWVANGGTIAVDTAPVPD